jgi:hypothetical protein
VHILDHRPSHRLPGLDEDADRIEPHLLPPRIAAHPDLEDLGRPRVARDEAGAHEGPGSEECAPSQHGDPDAYFGSWSSGTYHKITW